MNTRQKGLGHCWSAIRGPAMGFTRAELLVIVMTIGLLVGIFLPAVAKTDVVGPGIQCLENTRQLARALLLYSADYQEYLPPNPGWKYDSIPELGRRPRGFRGSPGV